MSALRSIKLKYLARVILLPCLISFTSSIHAITIGDYQVLSQNSVSIPLTQLDSAKYLDVTVDISGQPVNYILEQVNSDLVLINITDELLVDQEALITIKVDSTNGSASRLFSYSVNSGEYEITDTDKAKKILKEKQDSQIETKVLIPATLEQQTQEDQEVKFEDGKLSIDINNATVNVGIAVYELARASNYNVMVLPGDETVFNSPLSSSVSSWDELYLASNKVVSQVFFDEDRRLVRVVGENYAFGLDETDLLVVDNPEPEAQDEALSKSDGTVITVRALVLKFASINNLELIVLPGDDNILDQQTAIASVDDSMALAKLAKSVQAKIDIDESLGLIRVRSSGE